MGRSAQLDGIRGLTALGVPLYHAAKVSGLGTGSLAFCTVLLKPGVAVFFALSGYLLYRPFVARRLRADPAPPAGEFVVRRMARILPAYWLALTVWLVLGHDVHRATGGAWRYYALVQTADPDTVFGGLSVTWSLCVEAAFYVFLPVWSLVVGWAVRGRSPRTIVIVELTGTLALLATSLLVRTLWHGDPVVAMSLAGQLDWFAPGMALAVLLGARDEGVATRAFRCRARLWLGAAAALWLAAVATDTARDAFVPMLDACPHAAVGIAAGLVVLVVIETGRPQGRALRWAGVVSLGVYLWHLPVMLWAQQPLSGLGEWPSFAVLTLVGTVGALALGAASWYGVESRVMRALSRSRSRPLPLPAVTTAPEPTVVPA